MFTSISLDRTNFTVRCCSRPWGLRGCDSFWPRRKLSDTCIYASTCAQRLRVHTHQYTLRTHTHQVVKKRRLAWPRGRWKLKRKWRKSSVCCSVWADVPFWNWLFTTSCFEFQTNFRKFASLEGHKYALGQSERSSLTSHSIFVRQTPLPTSCWENS